MKRRWIILACAWALSLSLAFWLGERRASRATVAEPSADPPMSLLAEHVAPGPKAVAATVPPAQDAKKVVMDALAHVQAGMLNQSETIKALSLLQQLDPEDVAAAIAFLEQRATGPRQQALMVALVARWAENSPAEAMSYVKDRLRGQQRKAAMTNVLAAWAAKNPDEALRWFEGNQDEDDGRDTLGVIFGSLARRNLDSALAKLAALDPQDRALAVAGLGSLMFDDALRDGALAKVRAISDRELRDQATRHLASQWASFDPEAAAKWVAGQTMEESEQASLEAAVQDTWLQTDPKGAADWIMAHGEAEDRSGKINEIVSAWVYQSPNEAAEWLGRFPPGEGIDDALTTLAFGIMRRDFESAFAWANRITDPAKRETVQRNVFLGWHQRDAAAATAYLRKSSIPEADARRLADLAARVQR